MEASQLRTMCNKKGLSCKGLNGKYLSTKVLKRLLAQHGGVGEEPAPVAAFAALQLAPPAPPALRRVMGVDYHMNAREYYQRLREFNERYGYHDLNVGLPDINNIPVDMSLGDYRLNRGPVGGSYIM